MSQSPMVLMSYGRTVSRSQYSMVPNSYYPIFPSSQIIMVQKYHDLKELWSQIVWQSNGPKSNGLKFLCPQRPMVQNFLDPKFYWSQCPFGQKSHRRKVSKTHWTIFNHSLFVFIGDHMVHGAAYAAKHVFWPPSTGSFFTPVKRYILWRVLIFTESYYWGCHFFTEIRPFCHILVKMVQRRFRNMISTVFEISKYTE